MTNIVRARERIFPFVLDPTLLRTQFSKTINIRLLLDRPLATVGAFLISAIFESCAVLLEQHISCNHTRTLCGALVTMDFYLTIASTPQSNRSDRFMFRLVTITTTHSSFGTPQRRHPQ
jgi:hypothetical protein